MPTKGFRRNSKGVRRGPRKAKMSFPKRVLSVLNQQRELKCGVPLSHFITDVREGITIANIATNQLRILTNISQGTDETQRIGNKITLKKIVMRGYYRMQFPIGSLNNCRVLIRNLIMRQRSINSAENLIGGLGMSYNNILEPSTPYLGAVADYNTPINRDCFVVKKQFKRIMTSDFELNTSPILGADGTYVFFNYTMTFGKGKELNYRTGGATQPDDFPYILAQSASALGSNVALGAAVVGFNLTCTPYFYDV